MQTNSEKKLYSYVEDLIEAGHQCYSTLTIEDKLGLVANIILNLPDKDQINFISENKQNAKFLYNFLCFCISNNFEHRGDKKDESFNDLCTMAISYHNDKMQAVFNEVLTYKLYSLRRGV